MENNYTDSAEYVMLNRDYVIEEKKTNCVSVAEVRAEANRAVAVNQIN